MAAIPPAAAPTASLGASIGSFAVNLGVSYLFGRLTAQDGPRLTNLEAASGDYGVAMQRAYGAAVRVTGIFIAQADIKETEHTVEDHSELIGAATGAIQGFMWGGPVGAVIGGVVGGLFGAITPDQKYYTYSDTFALLLADRTNDDPVEGISKILGGGKVIFNAAETPGTETYGSDGKLLSITYPANRFIKSLTFYTGHMEQPVDPVLESVLEETSGYRPMAYAVVEDLQLEQFGQSVPTPEIIFTPKADDPLSRIAEKIAAAAGIDHTREISTTALIGSAVGGYVIDSETNCWDALKPLMPVYAVDAAEASGSVRFIKRTQSMRSTIPAEDMGGHVGDEGGVPIMFNRATDIDLPRETSLNFIDPERDYQPNTATSRRSEGNSQSNISISLKLTLTADEGASAAALIHWDSVLGRTAARFNVTDKWIGIEPGVAYAVPAAGEFVPYRLTRRLRGANGIIECEAVSDEAVTYTAVVAGTSGTLPDQESTLFPDTRIVAMDMPILADWEDDFGFYIAMAGGEPWWTRGFVQATGNGTNWATILDSPNRTVIGDVTGTLAAGSTTGLDDTLDTTSVLTVVLLHDLMTLENATDDQLDGYANFAFVGKNGLGEYLQFKTATKVGTATWELTNLRRGRKGTDHAIATHAADEEFVLLGGPGVFRIVYNDADKWGDALTLRGVTLHQDVDDADTITFTNTGEGKRPYSPVNVEGSWDGSNNLTITFDARSRMNAGGLGADDLAQYEVEITSGAGRTIATATESASYTAAEQTSDGLTPGDSISGRVRQLSDVNNGRWRDFFLLGPNAHTADTTAFTADATTLTADIG